MSTAKYFDTTHELELLSQLNEMVSKKEDKKKIEEAKEELVDYLIKLLAQIDLVPSDKVLKELLKGENAKLLEFLCTVDTPKLKRHYQQPDEIKGEDGYTIKGWYKIVWLTVKASDKGYGISFRERLGSHKIKFFQISSCEDN